MPSKPIAYSTSKVERDTRLFVWFMTLVIASMYAMSLRNNPTARQLRILIPFTVFTIVHIILHWQLGKITTRPSRILWYIIIQGVLALIISWLGNEIGMTFALFMALIGEAVGLLGLTRQGLFAGIYYLILLTIGLLQTTGWNSSGPLLLTTIPMIVFVVIYVTLYMRQNDAREQAQSLAAELESANRQLSEYAAQVEDLTIANERQRMARELHDTLSQGLAGLILQLEAADAHLNNNRSDKAQSIVGNAMVQARATLADARRAIDDLRQTSLDDLDSALRLEISRFTNATGIPILFHSDQTPLLPDPVKEIVLRAVAEALTNVANHAQAQNVAVDIRMKDKNLSVTIQDDGRGFDASAIPSGHYGLLGIRERVRLVNGEFEIQSENGKGTILKIEIPLSPLPSGEG
ncbi:MAG TPA: sensor histidine kinase [Anaerolineales bacterium]|nr:sensor histidine kinase [Anaerolineales bacterium]